tara:strand:- start:1996 stop:2298 length:303 start_codon:yes stop_codon:yes gene_type:complete
MDSVNITAKYVGNDRSLGIEKKQYAVTVSNHPIFASVVTGRQETTTTVKTTNSKGKFTSKTVKGSKAFTINYHNIAMFLSDWEGAKVVGVEKEEESKDSE